MPRYVLKGLVITLIVLLVLTGIGGGAVFLVRNNLDHNIDNARVRGYEEGYSQGFNEGLKEGQEAGYQEGSKLALAKASGIDTSNIDKEGYYFLYNPTYEEVLLILSNGELNTAEKVLDYTKANGMRAAYVRVPIARQASEGRVYLYQLVAFETLDDGLVIIEPLSHREVKVQVGQSYSRLNGFPPSDYDDTITKVTFVW